MTTQGTTWRSLERRRGRRRAMTIAVVLGGALAVAMPLSWASHQFADVPAGPHHDDISAIRGAGITAGCAAGLYCPDQSVRRDQMATFLRRGFGRVALSTVILDETVSPSPTFVDDTKVAQVSITVPGAGTGVSQFVKLDAHVTVQYESGTAPFPVVVYVADTNCGTGAGAVWGGSMIGTIPTSGGFTSTPISTSWVRDFAQPGPKTLVLCAFTSPATMARVTSVNLVATTFPFGSSGTTALGAEVVSQARPEVSR